MALRAPGRPKDMEKREAILDASQALFAERGLEGVPIEAIAARSGVSKVTVYGHFGDKATIFEAIVQRESDRLAREIAETSGFDGTLEDRLVRFGHALIGMLSQPCHIALDRVLSLEGQRNPALARRFFEAGPGQVRKLLTHVISDAMAQGEIAPDDPAVAAEDLLSLWLGFRMIERKFIRCEPVSPAALEAHIRRAARLFLRATAPSTDQSRPA